jgi:hypothetical protein
MLKSRAQIYSDYYQRYGAARQRARRDAQAAPHLRLLIGRARGPWARAVIEHAERALGAKRTLWLLRLRDPKGGRLDELARPLVWAMAPNDPSALAGPYMWLKGQLVAHGRTLGDYLHLPNC